MGGMFPRIWFDGLQSLRGMLFLLVFVSHSGAFFRTDGAYGAMAVSAFFVLSGFLCGTNREERSGSLPVRCIGSLWRKLRRFWPVYAVLLPVAAMLNPCGGWDFLKCLFLVQSYFGDAETALRLNWPTWFLSSILLSYLLSPVLVRVSRGLGRHAPWAILFVWAAELCWAWFWRGTKAAVTDPGYYWVYVCPLARLADFATGTILGECFLRRRQNCDGVSVPPVFRECLVALFAILSMLCHARFPVSFSGSALWAPVSASLIWVFALREGPLTRACGATWLMWIGRRSFELYVVHRMVLLFVCRVAAASPATWLVSLLATCVAAEFLASVDSAVKGLVARRMAVCSGGRS